MADKIISIDTGVSQYAKTMLAELTAKLAAMGKNNETVNIKLNVQLRDEATQKLQKSLDGLSLDKFSDKLKETYANAAKTINDSLGKASLNYADLEEFARALGRISASGKYKDNQAFIDTKRKAAFSRANENIDDADLAYFRRLEEESKQFYTAAVQARAEARQAALETASAQIQSDEQIKQSTKEVIQVLEEEADAFSKAGKAYIDFLKASSNGDIDEINKAIRELVDATADATGSIGTLEGIGALFSGIKPTDAFIEQMRSVEKAKTSVEEYEDKIRSLEDTINYLSTYSGGGGYYDNGEYERRIKAEQELIELKEKHAQAENDLQNEMWKANAYWEQAQKYEDELYETEEKLERTTRELTEAHERLIELQNQLNSKQSGSGNGNSLLGGGNVPPDELLQILKNIRDVLVDVSKSIGTISSEDGEVNSLVNQFERLSEVLDEIQGKVGTGIVNVEFGGTAEMKAADEAIGQAWEADVQKLRKKYQKTIDTYSKQGLDVFSVIWERNYKETYDSFEAIQNKYARSTIERPGSTSEEMSRNYRLFFDELKSLRKSYDATIKDIGGRTKTADGYEYFGKLGEGYKKLAELEKSIKGTSGAERETLQRQIEDVKNFIEYWKEQKKLVGELKSEISNTGVNTNQAAVKRKIESQRESLTPNAEDIQEMIAEEAAKANEEVKTEVSNLSDVVDVLTSIKDVLDQILAKDYAEEINSAIERLAGNLNDVLVALDAIGSKNSFQEFEKAVTDLGEHIDKIVDSIKEISVAAEGNSVVGNVEEVAKALKEVATQTDEVISEEKLVVDTEEWNKSISLLAKYKEQLGEVYDVYRQIRTNAEGERLISYRMVGANGNTLTVGHNGDLITQITKIDDALTKQKQLQKDIQTESKNDVRIAELRNYEQKLQQTSSVYEQFKDRIADLNRELSEAGTDTSKLALYENHFKLLRKDVDFATMALNDNAKAQSNIADIQEASKANQEKAKAAETERVNSILKEQLEHYENIWKINVEIKRLEAEKNKDNSGKLADLEDEKRKEQELYVEKHRELVSSEALIDSEQILAEQAKVRLSYERQIADISGTQDKQARANIAKDIGSQLGKLEKLEETPSKWTKDYYEDVERVIAQVRELQQAEKDLDDFLPTEELKAKWESLSHEVKDILGRKTFAEVRQASEVQLAKLNKQIEEIMAKNTAMGAQFRSQWQNLKIQLDSAESVEEVKRITAEINNLQARMNAAGRTGQRFIDVFAQRLKSLNATFLSRYLSFYDLIRYARSAITAINDLDYALVDLKKTTSMNSQELEQFYYDASDVAKTMGTTTEEIINQAAAWSRLGYSTKEASTEMAALSSQFAAISPGMSLDTATDGLVSTMKAFHIGVEDVEQEMMDAVNRIGNTMATTNEEIVNMLTRSSAAMGAANNSLAETIALESAAVQVTRNAETTGTAFRTISMRIRGYDEETEELSEDLENIEGVIADLTKTTAHPMGVSLFKDKAKTEYKSTYQILKDISEIYDELTDKQQAQLLEKLAGKRGGQVLAGILGKQNFNEVERALGEIKKSAGSADAEMSIVEQSLTYKMNALKQTWIGTLQQIVDRGDLGVIVDGLTKFSEALGFVIEKLGILGTLAVGGGFAAIIGKGSAIWNAIEGFSALGKVDVALKVPVEDFEALGKSLQGVSKEYIVATMSSKKYSAAQIKATLISAGYADATWEEVEAMSANTVAESANVGITKTLSSAYTHLATSLGLSTAGLTTLIGALVAVGAGIVIAKKAFDEANVTVAEVQENIDSITAKISDLNSQISQLEDIDYRNAAQQDRLDLLRDELEVQEELLRIEERRKALEQSGNSFTDTFDKDNWNTYLKDYRQNAFYSMNDETNQGQNYYTINYKDYVEEYKKTAEELKHLSRGTKEYNDTLDKLSYTESELTSVRDGAFEQYAALREKIIEMDEALEGLNPITDSVLIENIKRIRRDYQKEVDTLKEVIDGTDKLFGTYDYSSFYESMFQHAEYKGTKDYLVQLGKDGKLSVQQLEKEFPNLIAKINAAGGSAEDLYNWLMNIADPLRQDRLDFLSKWNPPAEARGELKEYSELYDKIQEMSDEDFTALLNADIDWSTFDIKDVLAKIQEMIDEADPLELKAEFSNQDFSENLTTKLGEVQSSYESFIEDIVNGEKEVMDIDAIESLRKDLVRYEEDEHGNKNPFGVTEEQFKKFEDVVSSSTSTVEEMQDAYDTLSTHLANAYFDNITDEMQNVDDATKQLIKDQLELKGYTEESVDKYVEYKAILKDTAQAEADAHKERIKNLETETKRLTAKVQNSPAVYTDASIKDVEDTIDELEQYIKSEMSRANQLGVDLGQTVYMNIDTDARQILYWSQENVEKFKDALLSWVDAENMSQQEMQNYLNQYLGSYSTVDAATGTFGANGKEIDIAFTPILNTESGPIYLDQETVTNYINAVLSQVEGTVTPAKIQAIDAEGIEGFEYEGERIKGLIAGIGDEAEKVSESMHFTGATGSIKKTADTIEALQKAIDEYSDKVGEAGRSSAELTEALSQISNLQADQALLQFAADVDVTTDSLMQYTAQLMVANSTDLNNEESVAQLQNLMASSGLTTEVIIKLIEVMQIYQSIASGVLGTNTQAVAEAKTKIQGILKEVETLQTEGIKIEQDPAKVKSAARKTGGGAGKEAGDAYKEAFEKELEKLKNAYERGDISLKDYLAQWKALIQKFFADNPKYAEEYANQMKSYLDAVKGYYSGAISGVTTILQGRISALQRQKDKAIKQLEKEKEAALEAYDVQIKAIEKTIKAKQKQIKQLEKEKKAIEAKKKPLQDEIDAINKANEERDRQLQLQKDLYELERLQNQRTQFVLKDGQMVYQADATAARDQREQVKKDEDEQKIAALEKQIELYDKQIEAIDARIESINEEIELLEEEKELLEEQRAAVEEYYDKLIKETEEMFDEMIEGLEEVLEKWQQLAEIETIANAWKQGGEVFEAMGLTIEDVLNDAPGAFEKFRDAWIQVLMDSENGNQHYAEGIKEWGRQNEQTIDGVVDSYKKLGTEGSAGVDPLLTPLDEATTKTQGLGTAASTSAGNVGTLATNTGTLADNAGTLAEKAGDAEENLNGLGANVDFTDLTNKLDALKLLIEDVAKAIYGGEENSIKTAIDNLNTLANLEGIIAQFELLAQAVSAVSSALGGGGEVDTSAAGHVGNTNAQVTAMAGAEGAAGSLADAISQLNAIKLDGDDGIIGQFEQLKQAVDAVTSAISGGGGGEGDMSGVGHIGNTNAQVTAMQGSGEGGDTLISAIEAAKTAAIDNIGMAEEEGETAVGSFMALEGAVTAGTDAIGAEGKSPSLIDGIYKTKEATEENIPPVIALFENLSGVLSACASSINKVVGAIERLTSGGFGGVKLPFFTYSGTAQSGKASLKGDWGFEGGETLIGELGPEIAVLPNGTYKVFDKPQLTRLPKDTVIFNHLQSEEILKRKNQISRFGKSNADGSNNGLLPLQGAALNDMLNLAKAIGADTDVMKMDIGDIKRHAEEISRTVQNVVNHNTSTANVTFGDLNFTCNGISTPEVLSEVENALSRTFEGMALNAYQHAMAR